MKKYYTIYQITNTINGMIYIGQHVTANPMDKYMGSSEYLKRAIAKYGISNFKKEILFYCNSFDEMNEKEKELVNEDFVKREDTYNLTVGGTFGWKNVFKYKSKEEQQQIRRRAIEANKRKIESMTNDEYKKFCQKCSENSRKWHNNNIGFFKGRKNPMYNHKYTDDTIKKMSDSHIGKLNYWYGMMWITNINTHENKRIKKGSEIPPGWIKGRWCNKNKRRLEANWQATTLLKWY